MSAASGPWYCCAWFRCLALGAFCAPCWALQPFAAVTAAVTQAMVDPRLALDMSSGANSAATADFHARGTTTGHVEVPGSLPRGLSILPPELFDIAAPEVDIPINGPFDIMNYAAQVSTLGAPVPAWSGWAFLAIVCAYIATCCWYDLWYMRRRAEEKPSRPLDPRGERWDFVKFFVVIWVVWCHIGITMYNLKDAMMYSWLFIPWVMPILIMISGVFSASLSQKSLISTLVGFPLTLLIFDVIICIVTAITPGRTVFQMARSGVEWYLHSMFAWRLLISPLFALFRRLNVPTVVPFFVVCVISYLIWYSAGLPAMAPLHFQVHWFKYLTTTSTVELPEIMRTFIPVYAWRPTVLYAPIFAFGLLLSPDAWAALLFQDRRVTGLAYVFLIVYHAALCFSPAFQGWYDVSCYHVFEQCVGNWWPKSILDMGIGLHTTGIFARMFIQRQAIAVAWIAVFGSWVTPLKRFSPQLAEVCIGGGSRTFYSYLLHWALFIIPANRTSFVLLQHKVFPGFDDAWPIPITSQVRIFCGVAAEALIVHLALTSQFTDLVFGFLIKTPIWIASYSGVLVNQRKDDSLVQAKMSETAAEALQKEASAKTVAGALLAEASGKASAG